MGRHATLLKLSRVLEKRKEGARLRVQSLELLRTTPCLMCLFLAQVLPLGRKVFPCLRSRLPLLSWRLSEASMALKRMYCAVMGEDLSFRSSLHALSHQ